MRYKTCPKCSAEFMMFKLMECRDQIVWNCLECGNRYLEVPTGKKPICFMEEKCKE